MSSFRTVRDMVMFTNKRIIAVNVQGITGKKKDYTSLPYSKIQAFSVESAGTFDLDAELELWFSGLGKVRFEFSSKFDVKGFNRFLGVLHLVVQKVSATGPWIRLGPCALTLCNEVQTANPEVADS